MEHKSSQAVAAGQRWVALPAVVVSLLLAGCDEPRITTYRVARDRPMLKADPHAGHGHDVAAPSRPRLTWTLPAGWQEADPGRVNLAAFNLPGPEGRRVQVTVAALPLLAGREVDVVNLWRGQLGLGELTPEQAREQLKELAINEEKGSLFELTSGEGPDPEKIVTVMIHRATASWFYKLSGHGPTVESHRAAFLDFIKTVREDSSPAAGTAAAAPPAGASGGWAKAAPAAWKNLPPGPMQAARFAVPEVQGATGLVSVSIFDSDTGGTLPNVNRWRGQIGLAGISEAQLAETARPLDSKLPRSILVDMTNNTQQLLGAIVPRGAQWYFYKLSGNPAAVSAQRDAFIRFAATEPAHD